MHLKKLCLLLMTTAILMTGCTQDKDASSTTPKDEQSKEVSKLGLGRVISISRSMDAKDDKDGIAQVDSTIAAVKLDENGVIVDVDIDDLQTPITFDKSGVITTDKSLEQKSKKELGDDYGMKVASPIKKEWYEQIQGLEDWMTGKTIDEVNSIKIEKGAPAEEDLKSSVTMNVESYIAAVNEAVELAKDANESSETKLGLGHVISIENSRDAANEKNGAGQVDSAIAAVQVDKDGVITAVDIDDLQNMVEFNSQGVITSDKSLEQKSKKEFGDDYGMKVASPIKKEWNEQIAELEKWIVGKTVEDLKGINLEKNAPADEDLKSSVTIKVNNYIDAVIKAVNNAE